jgi:16S rRNA (guanine527-N7)-methyltransferase
MQTLVKGAAELGIELTPQQIEQFQRYSELLAEWNKRINLTGFTDYEEVQTKHFLDSLTIIPALAKQKDAADLSIIDVGSGAGLPGIPLKIVLEQAEVVLLESVGKKTAFLEELVKQLHLDKVKVKVITGRAEEVAHQPECRERFSVAVSRALAKLPTLVELTLPFCKVGGINHSSEEGRHQPRNGRGR